MTTIEKAMTSPSHSAPSPCLPDLFIQRGCRIRAKVASNLCTFCIFARR